MNIREFRAFAAKLHFIDREQLPGLSDERWLHFRDDPAKFVLRAALLDGDRDEIEAALARLDAQPTSPSLSAALRAFNPPIARGLGNPMKR